MNSSSRPLKSPNCFQLAFKSCISARERMSFSMETKPLLFSWLLWSSNLKKRFLLCGWFCKQRVKTKLRIRIRKIEIGRPLMKWGAGQRDWEWTPKCDQCMFWEKIQVPEEVPQSPWPQVWGCGRQSRPWHPLCGSPEEFQIHLSHTIFISCTFSTQLEGLLRWLNFHLLWRLLEPPRFWCWVCVLKIIFLCKIRNPERSKFNSSLPLKLVYCVTRNESYSLFRISYEWYVNHISYVRDINQCIFRRDINKCFFYKKRYQ